MKRQFTVSDLAAWLKGNPPYSHLLSVVRALIDEGVVEPPANRKAVTLREVLQNYISSSESDDLLPDGVAIAFLGVYSPNNAKEVDVFDGALDKEVASLRQDVADLQVRVENLEVKTKAHATSLTTLEKLLSNLVSVVYGGSTASTPDKNNNASEKASFGVVSLLVGILAAGVVLVASALLAEFVFVFPVGGYIITPGELALALLVFYKIAWR